MPNDIINVVHKSGDIYLSKKNVEVLTYWIIIQHLEKI